VIRIILFIALAVWLFLFFRWLSRQPRRVFWQSIAGVVAVILILMVVTGRAHWLAAVFAATLALLRTLLPLISHIPMIRRVLGSAKAAQSSATANADHTSTVQAQYVVMTLDHGTGEINGEVLLGPFKGRMLDQLELHEIIELLQSCQDDEESVALLEAYLDRYYGETWKEQTGKQGEQQTYGMNGEMSRDEALDILGLSDNPSDEEIVQAHRRLMQTLHPDRGGSSYLSAKINLAKKTLLGK